MLEPLKMARNKIAANTNLFNILRDSLAQNGLSDFQEKLFINSENEHRDFLENATIGPTGGYGNLTVVSCHDGTKVTELYYNKERLVLLNRDFAYETPSEAMVFIEQNACIFTILAADGFIRPRLTPYDASLLYDQYIWHENDQVKGIDYSDIRDYYDSFCILKLKNSDMQDYSLERIACYLMNFSAEQNCIKKELYSMHVRESIDSLILNGDKSIPFDIILSGISSYNNPKNLFLELYRSIEKLYPDRYIRALKEKLGIDICENKLSSDLEEVTGWRPNEESALKYIVSSLDPSLITATYSALKNTKLDMANEKIRALEQAAENQETDEEARNTLIRNVHTEKANIIASRIYKIRNSLVHFRALLDNYIDEDDLFIVNGTLASLLEITYATD